VVNALAAHFPLAAGGDLIYYHASPVERYVPVAPGIEVSVEPSGDFGGGDAHPDPGLYNRRGRIQPASRKGGILDAYL